MAFKQSNFCISTKLYQLSYDSRSGFWYISVCDRKMCYSVLLLALYRLPSFLAYSAVQEVSNFEPASFLPFSTWREYPPIPQLLRTFCRISQPRRTRRIASVSSQQTFTVLLSTKAFLSSSTVVWTRIPLPVVFSLSHFRFEADAVFYFFFFLLLITSSLRIHNILHVPEPGFFTPWCNPSCLLITSSSTPLNSIHSDLRLHPLSSLRNTDIYDIHGIWASISIYSIHNKPYQEIIENPFGRHLQLTNQLPLNSSTTTFRLARCDTFPLFRGHATGDDRHRTHRCDSFVVHSEDVRWK